MVPLAPRYDERIFEAVRALDDREQPIAETVRRVGAFAEKLAVPRPSYSHLRRIVLVERERADADRRRKEAIRAIAEEVAGQLLSGRIPHPYVVAERVERAGR